MVIIGVDLGTTNSAVSVYRNGKSEVIPNHQNERTTPSVFQVKPNHEEIVGNIAKKNAASYPKSTVMEVKRLMGSEEKVHILGRDYRPEEISSKIIRFLKQNSEKVLNKNVVEAVITVPAYFTDAQRKATKDAGELAGLKIERIINEPTAAALAFGHDNMDQNRYLLVYDLGGGTFDVSVVEIFEGIIEVKSSVGDNSLGGTDFDYEIINLVKQKFHDENGYTMESISTDKDLLYFTLKEMAEETKISLSNQVETEISIPFVGLKNNFPISFKYTISRDKFENLIAEFIDRTESKVEDSLHEAGLSSSDISEVLMVGGSTRIPYVQESVRKIFGSKIRTDINPDEVVAQGAAVQAALKSGGIQDSKKNMVAIDVCPYTLGVSIGLDEQFDPFIKKNTPIPFKVTKYYETLVDNQTEIILPVYQGENKYSKDNNLVSEEFVIFGIPPATAGAEKIEVQFGYDINGLVEINAKIMSSGKIESHFVQTQFGVMNTNEKNDSFLRMNKEEENALLIEHVKQAIYRAEKLKNNVSEKEKKRLDTLIDRGKHAISTGNERQLRTADQQLLDLILNLI